jgi:hypothetical protein
MSKALHNNETAQKSIVESVVDWYKWCCENSSNHETPNITSANIGHISTKNVSVKLECVDNGGAYTIYFDLENWFVRGHMNGKQYRFNKKALKAKSIC